MPVPHRQGSSLGSERARDARWTRAGDRARAGTVLGVRAWAEPMLILHVQADPPRQPRTHPCNPKETQGSPVTVLSERGRSAAPALPAPRPRSCNRGRDSPPSPVPEAKASCRHAGTAPCRMVEALPQVRARTDPNPRARGTGRATASPQPYWELQQPPAAHRHGSNPWRSSEVCFAAGHQDRTQVTSGMEGAEPTLRTTMGFPCLGGGGVFCSQGKGRIPPPPPLCHGRTPLQPATFTVARLDSVSTMPRGDARNTYAPPPPPAVLPHRVPQLWCVGTLLWHLRRQLRRKWDGKSSTWTEHRFCFYYKLPF